MAQRQERSLARRMAVQALYQHEITGEDVEDILQRGLPLVDDDVVAVAAECVPEYTRALVTGTVKNMDAIDQKLRAASENWSLGRMPVVDRAILRMAVFEMLYGPEGEQGAPVSVAINEAVELAKALGGEDDSPRFVNGILGRIAKGSEAPDGAAAADTADVADEGTDVATQDFAKVGE